MGESPSADRVQYFYVPSGLTTMGQAATAMCLILLALYFSSENSPFFPGIIAIALIGAYGLYSALELSADGFLTIRFFEHYAKYGALRATKRLDYAQIERIEKSQTKRPPKRLRTRVLIFPRGKTEPIVIPVNPKNYFLKVELFSWLSDRVEKCGMHSPDSTTPV